MATTTKPYRVSQFMVRMSSNHIHLNRHLLVLNSSIHNNRYTENKETNQVGIELEFAVIVLPKPRKHSLGIERLVRTAWMMMLNPGSVNIIVILITDRSCSQHKLRGQEDSGFLPVLIIGHRFRNSRSIVFPVNKFHTYGNSKQKTMTVVIWTKQPNLLI